MLPKQDRASMNAYYGDPDKNNDGSPDLIWEGQNIIRLTPPYRMVLAWAPEKTVSAIRVHRKCADALDRILRKIYEHYGSQAAVEQARLHLYGGAYMFRLMRGAHQLSIHSWGAAIDLDPEGNPFGGKVTMPQAVVDIFAHEGWVWGGPWHTHDGMHFQAANT